MNLSALGAPARMQFCEASIAGLIKHPADTWTNIGPLVAGVMILRSAVTPLERLLGAAALWTAVASAYFHASDTVLGETLDLSGMFLFILSTAALQQFRLTPRFNQKSLVLLAIGGTGLCTLLSLSSSLLASPAFAMLTAVVVMREVRNKQVGIWILAAGFSLAVAWGIWWLDYLHILCNPDNHLLGGHGVWHLLNGLVFWFTYLHFKTPGVSQALCDGRRDSSARSRA